MKHTAWLIALSLCTAEAIADLEPDCVGLTNQHIGITLRKSDGALLGIYSPDGRNLLATNARASLWSVELIPDGTTKPVTLSADKPQRVTFTSSGGPAGRTLHGVYEVAGTNSTACTVKIEIALCADSPFLRWRLVGVETKGGRLWSVTYPQIPVGAFDAEPAQRFEMDGADEAGADDAGANLNGHGLSPVAHAKCLA